MATTKRRTRAINTEAVLRRDSLVKFARLKLTKAKLDALLSNVNEELEAAKEDLRTQFEVTGIPKTGFLGATVYLHKQIWGKPREGFDAEAVCRVLKNLKGDYADMVADKYNSSTLSAYLREREAEFKEMHKLSQEGVKRPKAFRLEDYLPKALVKVLEVKPAFDVRLTGKLDEKGLAKLEREMNHGNKS